MPQVLTPDPGSCAQHQGAAGTSGGRRARSSLTIHHFAGGKLRPRERLVQGWPHREPVANEL